MRFIRRFIMSFNDLLMVMLIYCMVVFVLYKLEFLDLYKNFVKVFVLVRLYVMVFDRVY